MTVFAWFFFLRLGGVAMQLKWNVFQTEQEWHNCIFQKNKRISIDESLDLFLNGMWTWFFGGQGIFFSLRETKREGPGK